jgi:hypothetical protein
MTLDRIDTLIGFATVMLGISLMITILNQMIASLLGHRATYLLDGVKDLLETLDPALKDHVDEIATTILSHKLVSDSFFAHSGFAPLRWRLATSIRPEELTKLLSLIASGKPYENNVTNILLEVNPTIKREAQLIAGTVNSIGGVTALATADQLIKQLSEKASNAVGRMEAAFSSTMDRVSQRFTMQMRIWTIVFSLLTAFLFHINVIRIYATLAEEPALRASLVNSSGEMMKYYQSVQTAPSNVDASKSLNETYSAVKSKLDDSGLSLFSIKGGILPYSTLSEFLSVLATAGLLSLGAPFWFNALKGVSSLRSSMAQKQTKEGEKISG